MIVFKLVLTFYSSANILYPTTPYSKARAPHVIDFLYCCLHDDCMTESSRTIVLGAIRNGNKSFKNIQRAANISPQELDDVLGELEKLGMIRVEEKKGWLGKKIEITITEGGEDELDGQIADMQDKWGKMISVYKSGDKKRMNQTMNDYRSFLPMMIFFGVIDMMMFSMMFSMMGASMGNYVPADQVPQDAGGDADSDMDADMDGDPGGFDIDIGF